MLYRRLLVTHHSLAQDEEKPCVFGMSRSSKIRPHLKVMTCWGMISLDCIDLLRKKNNPQMSLIISDSMSSTINQVYKTGSILDTLKLCKYLSSIIFGYITNKINIHWKAQGQFICLLWDMFLVDHFIYLCI